MKPILVFLTVITLILVFDMAASQAPINNSSVVTPADALKAYGNSNIEPMTLMGKSFAVFQSPAFKKDGVKGQKSVQTKIDQNVSRNETPGQPTGLREFILWYNAEIPETKKSSAYSENRKIPTFDTNLSVRIPWTPPSNIDDIPIGPGNSS